MDWILDVPMWYTKDVLRFLHGIFGYGLRYDLDGEVRLQGYTDSDRARSEKDR